MNDLIFFSVYLLLIVCVRLAVKFFEQFLVSLHFHVDFICLY